MALTEAQSFKSDVDKMATQNTLVRVTTTEMHTAGDPVRIIENGYPTLKDASLLEKVDTLKKMFDHLRKMLTQEPRGHCEMCMTVLVDADVNSGADVGLIFANADDYVAMCGHMTLAVSRYIVDKGLVKATSPVTTLKLQTLSGLVTARVDVTPDGKTGWSSFVSVPAFVYKTDIQIHVENYGLVRVDISYGGEYYAILNAAHIGLDLTKSTLDELTSAAIMISDAVRTHVPLMHPITQKRGFLLGTILTDGNDTFCNRPTLQFINYSEKGQVARSPCGSGTVARMALLYFKKHIAIDQERVFENAITHSQFVAMPIKEFDQFATTGAVEIEIKGRSHYTGAATFTVEEDDALGEGFLPGS